MTSSNTLLKILNAAIIGLMLVVLGLMFTRPAHAATITRTLDFQDNPPELNGHSNFNYRGLRFSAPCSIHQGHGNEGQIWMASNHDNSNCEAYDSNGDYDPDALPNPNFLGTGSPDFYVDRHGATFSLLGLAGAGFWGTEFSVTSSKGGVFSATVPYACCEPEIPYVLPYEWFALTGPLWTDITWFTLSNDVLVYHQSHQGWDDIRYSARVPEPTTLALVLVPLLAIGFVWRFPKFFQYNKG